MSAKLKFAAVTCNQVFNAWARGEQTQLDDVRDSAIARAAGLFANSWAKAEAQATNNGSGCGGSAATGDAVLSDITAGAGNIVASINTGLNVSNHDDLVCSGNLIKQAGMLCNKLLQIETAAASGVPQQKLDKALAGAMNAFTRGWARADCGSATADAISGAVSALSDTVAADTLTPAP